MTIVTETTNEISSVLIISNEDKPFTNLLREELKKYSSEVFFSAKMPQNLSRFEYIFLVNEVPPKKYSDIKRLSLIYINQDSKAKKIAETTTNKKVKIISMLGNSINAAHIDKILWFSFSRTNEVFLKVVATNVNKKNSTNQRMKQFSIPKRKTVLIVLFVLFVISHIAFIPPLALSLLFSYKGIQTLKENKLTQTEEYINISASLFAISKSLFLIPRSSFLLFSFSLPDHVIDLEEKTLSILKTTVGLEKNAKQLIQLILQKEKTSEEKNLIEIRLAKIKKDLDEIRENLIAVEQIVPNSILSSEVVHQNIKESVNLLSHLKSILAYSDFLLAKDTTRTYLLLFANNMELRPGGGFIGSFGILNVEDYTLKSLKIYDVYDADGQLIAHVEPPSAIRNYLNQPNWFLRDSAFAPDFLENYAQAKFFLEKEMDIKEFSGGILLTTTAIQNILRAYGDVYLADFNERVNDKNFYLKAQYYSETNFFPGSIQKKNFLGSLASNLLINIDMASQKSLAREIKKSLDDKQIVLYFDNLKLQEIIDAAYWSGRTINPNCSNEHINCISDYLFPYEANLGVNKANFFVTRSFDLNIHMDDKGIVENTFSVQIKNDSPSNAFPGGSYKNYFQILLPVSAEIKKITKDGVLVEDFEQSNDQFKKIGFLLQLQPKTISEIKVTYILPDRLFKGKNIYQLILQKQIGLANSDLTLRLNLAKNIHLLTKNFPTLVKDREIIYNTSLSADKIYLLELTKE